MEIIDNNLHSIEEVIPETSNETDIFKGELPMMTSEEMKSISKADDSLAFSIYEQIKGVPYTIKYFNLNSGLFTDRSELKDGHIMKMARYIDSFVSDEIERRKLIDSTESYHSIMNKLKIVLNIDRLEKDSSVLEKIYKFIKRYHGVPAYKN